MPTHTHKHDSNESSLHSSIFYLLSNLFLNSLVLSQYGGFEFDTIRLSTACQQDALPRSLGRELILPKFQPEHIKQLLLVGQAEALHCSTPAACLWKANLHMGFLISPFVLRGMCSIYRHNALSAFVHATAHTVLGQPATVIYQKKSQLYNMAAMGIIYLHY